MARGNVYFQQHAWEYFAFRRLLRCSDDRGLSLVEKNQRFVGFSGRKPPSNRRILFTVGNVDRDIGRHSDRYSGRHSVDSRSILGRGPDRRS